MPTIREVKNKFDDLIAKQKKVLAAYDSELAALRDERAEQLTVLQAEVEKFLPALQPAALDALTIVATQAGLGIDFSRMAETMREKDRANRIEYTRIADKRGVKGKLEKDVNAKTEAVAQAALELKGENTRQDKIDRRLSDIDVHNEVYPGQQITEKTFDDFRGFKLFSFIFSPSWRSAHNAVKNYEAATGSFSGDLDGRKKGAAKIKTLEGETLPVLRRDHAALQQDLKRMNELDSAHKGEAEILAGVQAALADALTQNDGLGKALADAFGEEAAKPLVLAALKTRNLGKLEDNLSGQRAQAAKTLSSLESPMSKINKGARNRPSKSVNIDLDNIEKSVNAGTVVGAYRVTSSSQARSGIAEYQPSRDDSMFNFTNLMLLYLIFTSNSDPAYVHSNFGLDEQTAGAAHVDLNNLQPDIAGTLENIGDAANLNPDLGAVDLSNIDVGSVAQDLSGVDIGGSVDVGNTDMGNVDVGSDSSFNVDSSSLGSDLGSSSGGYDSGSSSGGYDSGSGGGGYDSGGGGFDSGGGSF